MMWPMTGKLYETSEMARLFGQKFVFIKWGFADVGLSTAPFAALCAGQERAARWVTRSITLRRLLQRGQVPVVKRIRHAAVKRTMACGHCKNPDSVRSRYARSRSRRRANTLPHYLIDFHSRSTNMLSRQQPLPSMLMAIVLEQPREIDAGELAALVGIENLRLAGALHRFLHCLNIEICRQRVRQALHRNITDIGSPDVVRPLDLYSAAGMDRTHV
jgi:hypothetical protein